MTWGGVTITKKLIDIAQIAEAFAEHFVNWKITLPRDNLNSRRSGHISQAGWLIQ
jgi:hypothetical protein